MSSTQHKSAWLWLNSKELNIWVKTLWSQLLVSHRQTKSFFYFCRHKTYFNNLFIYLRFKLKVHFQVINGKNLWKPWAKLNLNSLCYEKGTMFRITITNCQINCEKLDWSLTESTHVVPFFHSNMKHRVQWVLYQRYTFCRPPNSLEWQWTLFLSMDQLSQFLSMTKNSSLKLAMSKAWTYIRNPL